MPDKVMTILAEITSGKSYRAHKYSLDNIERPYIDYREDNSIWNILAGETDKTNKKYIPLKSLANKISTRNDQLLTYFLDGSRRVFKVDDIAYSVSSNRSIIYPIIAGQIGVACCQRKNKKLKPLKCKREFIISVPDIADANGKDGFFDRTTLLLNQKAQELKKLGVTISSIIPYSTSKGTEKKFEDLGTARIQDRMVECEKDLVKELVKEGKINQDNYLIKDGSLEYRPTKEDKKDKNKYKIFKKNYTWVLGVSKNFNPEACKDLKGKANPGFIAEIPLFHRTPAVRFKNSDLFGDMEFAVWYIRIREKKHTLTPFDGILKIEKILVREEEIENGMDTDEINILSAHIINERCPICYGSDLRWANHLYPIYLTETYIKSQYLSSESFLHLF